MAETPIEVLVVESSDVLRALLVRILNSDPKLHVGGAARNGREALELMSRFSPSVVLLDIEIPGCDGFDVARRIMETRAVPIVVCSGSVDLAEPEAFSRSKEVGAVACIQAPLGQEFSDFDVRASNLVKTVKVMSEVKVVRRWSRSRNVAPVSGLVHQSPSLEHGLVNIVGIGASTGGPPVVQSILRGLPKCFPVPVLIVQHIASGFLSGLVDWLDTSTELPVHVALNGVRPMPGHVYLAPDDMHLSVQPNGGLALTRDAPDGGLRPSVNRLFGSLADVYGKSAVGVLLTGMGRDGAQALKRMRDRGAVTIAQDRETSAVHGMPGEAIALGAATYVLPDHGIAGALASIVMKQTAFQEGAA